MDQYIDPSLSRGAAPPPADGAIILIVDDDARLRTDLRDYLQRRGFRVLEAKDAYDGLFLCAQYGAAIRLLMTEISLLPVSGIKLAENALRLWPHIQVLCMCRSMESLGVKYWMRYLGADYLPKPFYPDQLEEKLQALLWGRHGRDTDSGQAGRPDGFFPGHAPGGAQGQEGRVPGQPPAPIAGLVAGTHSAPRPASNMGDPTFWLKEF